VIKQGVQRDGVPPFGFGGLGLLKGPRLFGPLGPGFVPGAEGGPRLFGRGRLATAAKYLGITDVQLMDQLASGKSLAQIAASRGKSVAGLKDALMAVLKAKLDKAVATKLLTSAQEQQILSKLSSGVDSEINDTGAARFGHGLFRGPELGSPGAPPVPPEGSGAAVPAPPGANLPY
jgi:hypothetical protein